MTPQPSALSVACTCENLEFGVASAPGLKQGLVLASNFLAYNGILITWRDPEHTFLIMHNVTETSKL